VTDAPLLEFRDVGIAYATRAGEVPVIPALSFRVSAGEAMGLVGESGCGKSTVALSIVRYLGRAGRLVRGRILFEGRDLATLDDEELRAVRGRRIAMVYQDPMASLNPVMTVGRQLMEVPMIHEGVGAATAHARAIEMLREVKLSDPEAVMARYPHQLSGGQQQRIVIAMALIAEPALLVMDEPTTGLDVTVEAAVLDLVRELRRRRRTAILFISHNLGTVVRVCDRIGVMYRGELVEEGSIRQIFTDPRHPYTRGLLDCLPVLGRDKRYAPLVPIPPARARALAATRLRLCRPLHSRRPRALHVGTDPAAPARWRARPSRRVRPRRRAGAVGAAARGGDGGGRRGRVGPGDLDAASRQGVPRSVGSLRRRPGGGTRAA